MENTVKCTVKDKTLIITPKQGDTGAIFDPIKLNLCNYDFEEVKVDGTVRLYNAEKLFYNCKNLKTINMRMFDMTGVENITSMFEGCENLQSVDFGKSSEIMEVDKAFLGCNNLSSIDFRHTFIDYECAGDISIPKDTKIFLEDYEEIKAKKKASMSLIPDAFFSFFNPCEELYYEIIPKLTGDNTYRLLSYLRHTSYSSPKDDNFLISCKAKYLLSHDADFANRQKWKNVWFLVEKGFEESGEHPFNLDVVLGHDASYVINMIKKYGIDKNIQAYLNGVPIEDILA